MTANSISIDKTLSVTPAEGYYVTKVVVACCNWNHTTDPRNCETWRYNNAYVKTFSQTDTGTVTTPLPARAFGHESESNNYFILISVAPIPTPLYVEYDYGTIGELLGDKYSASVFADADSWTDESTANVYRPSNDNTSDGGVQTHDTQFKYTYATRGNMSDADKANAVKQWKHTTNTVTEEAKQAAAEIGYYFTGWKYTYYTKVTATETNGQYNNYKYTFSEQYSTPSNIGENTKLTLTTNVRLVAQWAPIQLKMTKTVSGLNAITDSTLNKTQTYKLTLQKQNADGEYETVQADVEYTITGDGSLSYTFAASGADKEQVITPGTYKVVETGDYHLTGTSKNAYCTTTYPVETVTVGMDGTVQELKVLNTYSETPATATITIKKLISGNMLSKNDEFTFTVSGESVAEADKSFELKDGESKTITVNIGDTITVSEGTGSYTTTYKIGEDGTVQNGSSAKIENIAADTTITFTNTHDITIDTGISLETLPYILILAVVALGAVVMIRKRRVRDED